MKQLLALTVLSLFALRRLCRRRQDDSAAGKDEGLQRSGDGQEGRRSQGVHEDLPVGQAAEKPKSKMAMCNEKTKGMTKDEAAKARSECMKAG